MKKERILELRALFLKNLEENFENIYANYKWNIDSNPNEFFKNYWKCLNSKCRRVRLQQFTMPLYKRDFTYDEIMEFEK